MELVPFLSEDHHRSLGCQPDFGSFVISSSIAELAGSFLPFGVYCNPDA